MTTMFGLPERRCISGRPHPWHTRRVGKGDEVRETWCPGVPPLTPDEARERDAMQADE